MVLKIFSSDSTGTGVRSELANGDVLFVGEDVTVARTDGTLIDDAAIRGLAGGNTLDIRGSVVALQTGILLGDNGAVDGNNTLTIAETALVKSFYGSGIRVNAYSSNITNAGHIEGDHGIDIYGYQQNFSHSTLTNSGSIFGASFGINRIMSASETLSVVNTGTITGGAYAYYSNTASVANDYVTNKGTMSGDIELGGGADEFDGRSGTLDGYVNGGAGSDTILGGDGADVFNGGNDADHLNGGAGDDMLSGGFGDDVLFGGAGNDTLKGETGADEHHGGAGNDTYLVGQSDDVIVELKGEGIDTVEALTDYTLSANVENMTLLSFFNSNGEGNELANTILGNEGQNTLKGMAGNDMLDGGEGMDLLVGGKGNDTYIVDNASDMVFEEAGEGTDTIKASVSYSLADNVDKLILTGTLDLVGAGNADANTLTGNEGKNTLQGMAGNDVLDGKAGIDTLAGGAGNDTYVVDNGGDVVTEVAGEGTDTVKASKSYTLSANVEKLILTGTGNLNGTGSADANTLTGNAGKNILKGMAGNDTLDGGAGADRMEGGKGNDTFVVDNAGDVVVEASGAGTGIDTVKASVSHTLAANVEKLTLTGSGNINGTGNELANTLTGNAGANILKGMAGNDTLVGGAGADKLYGGAGKDMFVFNSASDSKTTAMDKIFDFSHAEGDRIDLHAIDANGVTANDQAFSFIGTSAFHNKAGELRFEQKSGDTLIHGDINGDGKADFSIALDTLVTLAASDFLL